MDALALLFPLTLLIITAVGVGALTHRLLAALAWRNIGRRKRQSVLIVLGLLIGTAIIAGSLVTSDSMAYAIVEATYDAFQEIDETVYLDGYAFFPQRLGEELGTDAQLRTATDAMGSNILWDAAMTNGRTGQYEPAARLVGFDPKGDLAFGPFRAGDERFTGETLQPDEAVIHRDLARELDANVGDTITLRFAQPFDPALPRFETLEGHIDAEAGGLLPLPAPRATPAPWSRTFTIDPHTLRLSVVLTWIPDPVRQEDLDLELVAPDGRTWTNYNGTVGAPDIGPTGPPLINVTGSLAHPLPPGTWTVNVHAKAAVQTDFEVTLVRFEPVFDLAEFQRRVQALRDQFPNFDPDSAVPSMTTLTHDVRIVWISEGGKGPNFKLPTALNLFVRLDALQGWLGRPGEVNFVKVSNHGGVEDGPDQASTTYPLLYARLNASKAAHPDDPALGALRAGNDKVFWLEQAKEVGRVFTIFLTFVGSFSVVAGLLLIINIFTMLAEERKMELGVSRAVGMRRGHLTQLFLYEGALYSVPAAILGTFVGLGLAYGLIAGFNFFGDTQTFPAVPFRLEPASPLLAFAIGLLLMLATIFVGARRVSRLNIVRAIRRLDEPERLRTRGTLAAGSIVAALGLAATITGLLFDDFPQRILGPIVLTVGLGLLSRRRFLRRHAYPVLATALFAYLTFTYYTDQQRESLFENLVSPLRAVTMTLCLVVIVVYNERTTRLLGALALRVRTLRALALPAMSYPLHRKFRTGLTLAIFSVVLLVVSLFSILGATFTPNWEKEAGGYDVEATVRTPLDRLTGHDDVLAQFAFYDAVPHFHHIGGTLVSVNGETTGQFGPPQDFVYGIDAAFAGNNQFRLHKRDPQYATDVDAYRAAAASDDFVIVAYPYSTDRDGRDDAFGVGDTLAIEARNTHKEFRIIGVQEQYHFKGVWVSRDALQEMFPDRDTLFLLRLNEGVNDEAAAASLERAFRDQGMDAQAIRVQVLRESEQFRQITTLIQLFLGLGLVVGILSLGIVTARSVVERRQEIGMLRALGFRRRDVRRTFLLETLTTVTLGVLIGGAVAVLVSFGMWVSFIRDLRVPYTVPWADMAIIAAIAFVATVLSTLAPILRAAKTAPAEALRYIE